MSIKKLLSYLFDVKLESASTPLNPALDLSLRNGRFYLTTTNAVYSYGDLYENFLKTFEKLDFTKLQLKQMLVLGFGLGSVPYMLERVFHQKLTCIGVEADAKIVEWARRYCLPTLQNPTTLQLADALDFVKGCDQTFDLVVVDLFIDDLVPSKFETTDFLFKINCLLSKNGLLLFNRLADKPPVLEATKRFYEGNFKAVFPAGAYMEIDGNWMLANRVA